ncbi:MAG: hypothetical protein H2184_15865 [Candidatus Galacturonibacter soehngenii]|nr:hypothetical protein [Candidatus Galacturonibacter soehngenii]
MRERANIRKIIMIIFCIAIAAIGAVYQILHTSDINENKNSSFIQSSKPNYRNQLDANEKNVNEKSKIQQSSLEDSAINEEVQSEEADYYASEDWVDITNLEELTIKVNKLNTFQLKSQIKSYLDLSGYDIYLISIDADSVSNTEEGFQFESTLDDGVILYVTYNYATEKYSFELRKGE